MIVPIFHRTSRRKLIISFVEGHNFHLKVTRYGRGNVFLMQFFQTSLNSPRLLIVTAKEVVISLTNVTRLPGTKRALFKRNFNLVACTLCKLISIMYHCRLQGGEVGKMLFVSTDDVIKLAGKLGR